MNLNAGVKWPTDMHPSMWYARGIIDAVHIELTGQGATCTSAYRPKSPGGSSLHPERRAMDVRVWAFGDGTDPEPVRRFAGRLRDRLGPDFDVIVEGPAAENPIYKGRPPHVHVEYDPGGWAA